MRTLLGKLLLFLLVPVAAAVMLATFGIARACPFCNAESQTLSEETQSAVAVVIAKLAKPAPTTANSSEASSGNAIFKVVDVLRGQDELKGVDQIETVFYGEPAADQLFMITGITATKKLDWLLPLPLSPAAADYVRKLFTVAPGGADRLAFFQEYLEHADPLLAQDAYDEFARAPYSELKDLGPRMHHDRILTWLVDPAVSPNRRRLYFTMLSVCGSEKDVPLLETMITSSYDTKAPFVEQAVATGMALGGPLGLPVWAEMQQQDERRKKLGLDALVACYLTLRGAAGMDLIDEHFLKKKGADYTYKYCTLMALRFHGDEHTGAVPRERLLASVRLFLDDPDFADQIPLDLSRWSDWSVLDRLVGMFKAADKNGYIRFPVVSYLTVASEQPGDVGTRAKSALGELEKLDPEGVKQAKANAAFGVLARARSAAANPSAAPTVSATSATDATQGFGASAADVAAANDGSAASIPDPTEFQKPPGGEAATKGKGEAAQGSPSLDASVPDTDRDTTKGAAPPTVEIKPADPDKTTTEAAAAPWDHGARAVEPHRALVIALPLAAAAVLMGVYWVILRFGAV